MLQDPHAGIEPESSRKGSVELVFTEHLGSFVGFVGSGTFESPTPSNSASTNSAQARLSLRVSVASASARTGVVCRHCLGDLGIYDLPGDASPSACHGVGGANVHKRETCQGVCVAQHRETNLPRRVPAHLLGTNPVGRPVRVWRWPGRIQGWDLSRPASRRCTTDWGVLGEQHSLPSCLAHVASGESLPQAVPKHPLKRSCLFRPCLGSSKLWSANPTAQTLRSQLDWSLKTLGI